MEYFNAYDGETPKNPNQNNVKSAFVNFRQIARSRIANVKSLDKKDVYRLFVSWMDDLKEQLRIDAFGVEVNPYDD